LYYIQPTPTTLKKSERKQSQPVDFSSHLMNIIATRGEKEKLLILKRAMGKKIKKKTDTLTFRKKSRVRTPGA